jgi:endonuclease/exonuclease/phosphatase family metal-dependent hydrolase
MVQRNFLFVLLSISICQGQQPLRVVTLNVWTGLDYHGIFMIGEYESPEVRETRLRMVEDMLRTTRPDIVALQEVNPVHKLVRRIAQTYDYDFLYQRVNSGLKIGSLGIPWNLNEGVVILARKALKLELVDVWSLSNTVGVIGNVASLHAAEHDIALVGKINLHGVPVLLANVHTIAVVPVDSTNTANLVHILESSRESSTRQEEIAHEYKEKADEIRWELRELSNHINMIESGIPMIVLGDFNVSPNSADIKEFLLNASLCDAVDAAGAGHIVTWEPGRNSNILFSQDSLDACGIRLPPLELLSASYDGRSRRIDHVFLNSAFEKQDVRYAGTVLDSAQEGLFASDHYGLMAEISAEHISSAQPTVTDSVQPVVGSTVEPFPILSYDTDVGFGYGAKLFLLNPLKENESFDMVLFNSTKGERWYRFVFSAPDFEVRQGRLYPHAIDLVVDYDKYLRNSFFGVGNGSKFDSREYYTREPLEVSVSLSRGFSRYEVGQLGLKYKSVRNFNFSDTSRLSTLSPALNAGTARYHSLYASYRYDSRNSFVNPSRGWVLQAEGEYAPQTSLTNVRMGRLAGWIQYYETLFYPKTILAVRLGMQELIGGNLPVQMLLPIGGNQTLRGSPQDRFLDKTSSIANVEIRFPIYWRFGGVLGYDAGKVSHQVSTMNLSSWASNLVVGLRFFMETFVVRMDLGFGKETTGFYLNFGQLF